MCGPSNIGLLLFPNSSCKEKEVVSLNINSRLEESTKTDKCPYRPPHLRKREGMSTQPFKAWDSHKSSDRESSAPGFASSDSEHNDSDGSVKDADRFRCCKARISAIICIQDLCQVDPKSVSAHWKILLPTGDVLQLSLQGQEIGSKGSLQGSSFSTKISELDSSKSEQDVSICDGNQVSEELAPVVCSLCRDPDSKSPVSYLILLQKSWLASFVERGPPSWEEVPLSDEKHLSIAIRGMTDPS